MWQGIFPPMVTPLRDRDALDEAGLERLIEHILAGGVHGLFILGTTGEGPSLGYRLRRELIERTCRQVNGRVPILVGITDTSFAESVALAHHAAKCGAKALVLAPPYYFPASQPELLEYFRHLIPELPLPLFLYNMPMMTKVCIGIETVRELLDQPGIAGVKDSSGDMNYYTELLAVAKQRPDWKVLIGPEHYLAESVRLGGNGGISGGANLHPRLFVDMYDASKGGDSNRVAQLQLQIDELGGIYEVGQHISAVVKGLKCALSLAGICDDFMAEPFHRFRLEKRDVVRDILCKMNLIPGK
jgi:dihydrodipicolinate synthase/N-acetylneuraminate lyase